MKLIKQLLSTGMAISMTLSTIFVSYADYRDAGIFAKDTFSKDANVYTSTKNNIKYYPNNEGGYTIYVPYNQNMYGQDIYKNMFTGLFDIYKTGTGSNYASAGAKFAAPNGFGNIAGINTSYYTKTLSLGGINNRPGVITESDQATTDLHNFSPNYNVEFRYAGVQIGDTGQGTVITNPSFPSDYLKDGGGRTYQRYDKSGSPIDSVSLSGDSGSTVVQRSQLIKGWAGSSGVPTNAPSVYNNSIAEQTFEKWASTTEIGAAYKATYSNNPNGQTWWQFLNNYIRIDGDFRSQSVLLTVVWKSNGSTVYSTYGIPYPVKSNMIASKIQILDDKKKVLDYSERPLSVDEAISGAVAINKNVISKSAVKLERDKTYTIEYAFTFMSDKNTKTKTVKDSAGSLPPVDVNDTTTTENKFQSYNSIPASSMQSMTAEEKSLLDSSVSGPINTKQTKSMPLTKSGGESVSYNCGLTIYKNMSFTVDPTFPTNGIIRVVVPELYAQNGDNDYQPDDYIELNYTLEKTETNTDVPKNVSYGDMNLGQRELRSYHHKVTEEVKEEDGTDANGNPKYKMVEYEYEYATDFGTYESGQEGQNVGDWEGVPEASGSIYPIDEESWWEYNQKWPDQSEDSYSKIWLTKNGESWNKNDEEYYRSETSDYPFSLGFSTSRSRGQKSDSISPHLNVSIYGMSPDTDEDGELIETTSVVGNSIGTYEYNTNNYMYLLNNYIAKRYSDGMPNNADYPRIRIKAEIDKNYHGESGIYGDSEVSPYNNGWQDEHDAYERVFEAKSDDMELTDVLIKDAEGIVVYHATREDGKSWQTKVRGYFDKEEDYTMDVKLKQTVSSGHKVKNPTINVSIFGENRTGGNVSTYVDHAFSKDGEELGLDVETTFENIAFRPKDVSGVNFNIEINDIHNATNWRENIWNAEEDTFSDKIQNTTANLKISPNIELYNSKYNMKNYLTFAEKLNFKFDIQHIGEGERQMAVVGNSKINPLAKLDIAIYDADSLTQDEYGKLKFDDVKTLDPKSTGALIWTGTAQAKSRLYPGLGSMNYSTHVQSWINNYVVQSRTTLSGNKAAYGRILVAAKINDELHLRGFNENTSNDEDYIQQEYIGEHNISIKDMIITGQNSISDNSWYYNSSNRDSESGAFLVPNKNGIAVSVAISNNPSSFADPTVIDRTYLDIFVGDLKTPTKTVIVDIPQGNTVPVEVVLPDLLIEKDLKITAKVNYGNHQTHYEYVLPSTDTELNKDPFTDNVAIRTVSPNLPDKENAPKAEIIDGLPAELNFEE